MMTGSGDSGPGGTGPKHGEIVHIPFHNGEVLAVEIDTKPHVILRPALERLGVDYSAQLSKLRTRSWARVGFCPTQDQFRDMVTVDVRTFLMLLATIDERRVAPEVRDLLISYQKEVADVIEAHFTRGRINEDYQPFTWTLDEVCAIVRQRYLLSHHVQSLTALFRTAGIWKQNGTPTSNFTWCFHFTGTAWTVHPYGMAKIGARLAKVTQQLHESYGMQMRLELEAANQQAELTP